MLFTLCLVSSSSIFAFASNNFYNLGSDFYVVQTGLSQNLPTPPIILAIPYDSTQVYIDINNDGIYDYDYNHQPGVYKPTTLWPIEVGTKIHATKPIALFQELYYDTYPQNPFPNSYIHQYRTAVPPINNYKKEYSLRSGGWNLLALHNNKTQQIMIDTNFDGIPDSEYNLTKKGSISLSAAANIYSDEPFLAYNSETIGGLSGMSFFNQYKDANLVIQTDFTDVGFDYNFDGAIDKTKQYTKGVYAVNSSGPFRIVTNKPIAAYSSHSLRGTIHTFALLPSDYMTNQYLIYGDERFFPTSPAQEAKMIGLFNKDSGFSDYTSINLTFGDNRVQKEANTSMIIALPNGLFEGFSNMPSIIYGEASYQNMYGAGSVATNYYPYKQVYVTNYPKQKTADKNSVAYLNVRVFNPLKNVNVTSLVVKIEYNPLFAVNNNFPSAHIQKKHLIDDSVKNVYQDYPIPLCLEEVCIVVITLDYLGGEEYYDIDYSLITPDVYGSFEFKPATITYNTQTWQI